MPERWREAAARARERSEDVELTLLLVTGGGPTEGKPTVTLAPPVDRGREIRAFFRDPDGHLLEISEVTG